MRRAYVAPLLAMDQSSDQLQLRVRDLEPGQVPGSGPLVDPFAKRCVGGGNGPRQQGEPHQERGAWENSVRWALQSS
jgi:hypothetical protein